MTSASRSPSRLRASATSIHSAIAYLRRGAAMVGRRRSRPRLRLRVRSPRRPSSGRSRRCRGRSPGRPARPGRSPLAVADAHLVAAPAEPFDHVGGRRRLDLEHVRPPLVVEPRRRDRLARVHPVVDDVEHREERRRDDARPARAPRHEVGAAVPQHDRRRHARERPLAGRHRVRVGRRDEPEGVRLARRGPKSSISSFRTMPVPGTVMPEP